MKVPRRTRVERPLDPRSLDDRERFLVRIFLRRYIVWCARRRKIDSVAGAADLLSRC